jgi:hypothetical protein
MLILCAVFYLNKDTILPNPNATYEELYSTFVSTEGTIVNMESTGGKRSRTIYTIQFNDRNNNLVTVTADNWQTMPLQKGEKVTMYYNPQDPKQAQPESHWKEIMRK